MTRVVAVTVLAAMGVLAGYGMATHPPVRPVPACSLRLKVMRPCYDQTGGIR